MSNSTFTRHADHDDLSMTPPIRAIVADSLPPEHRSVPAALCSTAGELAAARSDAGPNEDRPILEAVASAIHSLEGYVRIRHELVTGDRYATADGRDAAVLASDLLHATAYATIDEVPVGDRRSLELYRLLTETSTRLSRSFLACTEDSDDETGHPTAILTSLAAETGAVAVATTDETRDAMRSYGRALGAALASRSDSVDDVFEVTARVLSANGSGDDVATSAGQTGSGAATTPVERHLERARQALDALEPASPDNSDASRPLSRLERATRVPFAIDA